MSIRKKIKLGVIFGGKSAEHEISIISARSIHENLDKNKYETILIGISKSGKWMNLKKSCFSGVKMKEIKNEGRKVNIEFIKKNCDAVFPVLHGTYGEDGTIQGLFEIIDIPYVGPGVLGSAVGMDKETAKRLLRDSGILIAGFKVLYKSIPYRFGSLMKGLHYPVFVKPVNLGSSVGISKAKNENELRKAIKEAFIYDEKVLIEQGINGREIECSVLGNEKPVASLPGEVVPHDIFYSYKAKYIDENGADLIVPVKLPGKIENKIRKTAIDAFKVLCCYGMARVDFFLENKTNRIYVNEINTIPGFTKISMYPKLWEATGLSYPQLLDKLIKLALAKYKEKKRLKTSYK